MNCLKCNHPLVQSDNSKYFGIVSYRCEKCHTLHSDDDFKYTGNLIKPKFSYETYNEYFDKLNKTNKVTIPLGMGRTWFLEEIIKSNTSLLVVNSDFIIGNYTNIKKITTAKHLFSNSDLFLKNNPIIIIDELHISNFKKMYDLLKDNKAVYFINPHKYK